MVSSSSESCNNPSSRKLPLFMACQRIPIVQNTGDTHLSFDIPLTPDFSHCFWKEHDDGSLIQDMAGQGRCDLNVATPDPDNAQLYIQEQRTGIQIEAPLPHLIKKKQTRIRRQTIVVHPPPTLGVKMNFGRTKGQDTVHQGQSKFFFFMPSVAQNSTQGTRNNTDSLSVDYNNANSTSSDGAKKRKLSSLGRMLQLNNMEQKDLTLSARSLFKANKLYLAREWFVTKDMSECDIRIMGFDMKNFIEGTSDIGTSLCRAFVLMLQYREACRRWHSVAHGIKHFFYDDKWFDYRSKIIPMDKCIDFYIHPTTRYPMTECRSFVAVTDFDGVWACYSFNIIQKVVCIMDPSSTTNDEDTIQLRHANNKKKILDRVLQYAQKIHGDPLIGIGDWQTSDIGSTTGQPTRKISGVYALLYAELVKPDIGTIGTAKGYL